MEHLHLHSAYSILDAIGTVDAIAQRLIDIGSTALVVTDHASITCLRAVHDVAPKYGLKPVVGCEFYITDEAEGVKGERRYHLITIPKSWAGMQSVMEQLTLANQQFYHRPRLTWQQALNFKECIITTACSSGMLSHDDYDSLVHDFHRTYGDDFYLEIMPHKVIYGEESSGEDGECKQAIVNSRAASMAKQYGIKCVATNDAHYVMQEDAYTHEIMLAIQQRKPMSDPKRWSFGGDDLFIADEVHMRQAFATNHNSLLELVTKLVGCPFEATKEVVDKIDVVVPEFKVELPNPYYPEDPLTKMRELAQVGWATLVDGVIEPKLVDTYKQRLEYEISVIETIGVTNYFLIVYDIIKWARENDIPVGPGRGSAGGSLLCYLLRITDIDPIKFGLFFERFQNPERVSLPDIDIDFAESRRQDVYDYIRMKYGERNTGQISTITKLSPKSAFRDVASAFGVPSTQVNSLSKLIDDADSWNTNIELMQFRESNPEIVKHSLRLDGVARSCGVHPAGIIISSQPLVNNSVLERRNQTYAVNWDMDLCESFGLLKVDALVISTLDVIYESLKLIKERSGEDINLMALPLNDRKTLNKFKRGESRGVFQFESGGMRQLTKSLLSFNFDTIVACNALYRPGPMESGMVEEYVRCANGEKDVEYGHELLKPILKDTYGVIIYQEQIMRIFTDLGGFTMAEADKMRKIIGKKLGADEFNKHLEHFLVGCRERGVDEDFARELFDKMGKFAAYSFNKAHAVAYALLAYWSMYVKCHYPLEYYTSLLSHTSKDDKIKPYVKDARVAGVNVVLPHVNHSKDYYFIDPERDDRIIAPLSIIKGVGSSAINKILSERKRGGPYTSVEDFVKRHNEKDVLKTSAKGIVTYRKNVNEGVIDKLKQAGAFGATAQMLEDGEYQKGVSAVVPIYVDTPHVALEQRLLSKEDLDALAEVYKNINEDRKQLMMPVTTITPKIMVINNPPKSEVSKGKLWSAESTRKLEEDLKRCGLSRKDVYYTSFIKERIEKEELTPALESVYWKAIQEEINIVKPKVVLAFVGQLWYNAFKSKGGIKEASGNVVHHPKTDTFWLFSVSPQWAAFNAEIEVEYDKAMKQLQIMVTGR